MRVRSGAAIPLLCLLAACRGAEEPAPRSPEVEPPQPTVAIAEPGPGSGDAAPRRPADEPPPPHLLPWRAATPSVSPTLELAVQRDLSEALIRVERALAAPADGPGRSQRERVAESLTRLLPSPDVRILLLDEEGAHVFPATDQSGFGHRDVHGRAVYLELFRAEAHQGLAHHFDDVSADGAEGVVNVVAWTRLDDPPWLLCAEGEEGRRREELAAR